MSSPVPSQSLEFHVQRPIPVGFVPLKLSPVFISCYSSRRLNVMLLMLPKTTPEKEQTLLGEEPPSQVPSLPRWSQSNLCQLFLFYFFFSRKAAYPSAYLTLGHLILLQIRKCRWPEVLCPTRTTRISGPNASRKWRSRLRQRSLLRLPRRSRGDARGRMSTASGPCGTGSAWRVSRRISLRSPPRSS